TAAVITRGTAKRAGPELDAAVEFVGGHLEAGAGRDGLSESLSVLKRDLGLGLDLLQEVVLTPAFPDDEVKRKIGEIQAAIQRSEESPETVASRRSEEHTSELQSRFDLVCRLLLEKKKQQPQERGNYPSCTR